MYAITMDLPMPNSFSIFDRISARYISLYKVYNRRKVEADLNAEE